MWSGSANHTKLDANASGSGFLNPDSGIFMRTPDSHRIRTVRYGSPPPDPIGLSSHVFVRVPGIWITHEAQAMLCLWPDQCHPGPAGPPNPRAYHTRLPLPFYGNSPESSRPGRASISVWLGGLGGYLRMGTRCRG